MLRDFDSELIAERDREFRIGGELFQFRYPHWEEGSALFDTDETAQSNGDGEFSFRADTEFAIKKIPMFLDPKNDAHKRFKTLAARKTDPVPRHQFVQLYRWLVQVTSGLPTTPPSEQPAGGGETDILSSAGSSSPEETSTG